MMRGQTEQTPDAPYCLERWDIYGDLVEARYFESLDEVLGYIELWAAEELVWEYEDDCINGRQMLFAPCARVLLMTMWDDEPDDEDGYWDDEPDDEDGYWDDDHYDVLGYVEINVDSDDLRHHWLRRVYDVEVQAPDDDAEPIMVVRVDSPYSDPKRSDKPGERVTYWGVFAGEGTYRDDEEDAERGATPEREERE